jgi:hypothetical protein
MKMARVLTEAFPFAAYNPCPDGCEVLLGTSCPCELPPVFFSSLALLKITVNPSAEAGSLTSHSPNLGSGLPFSCRRGEPLIRRHSINSTWMHIGNIGKNMQLSNVIVRCKNDYMLGVHAELQLNIATAYSNLEADIRHKTKQIPGTVNYV